MTFDIQKLEHTYFCTGARNHALLNVFAPDKISFEYDERMASFKALGLSKIKGSPIAICCTSGTAVSECISALLESAYSNTPIILISGDRPKKMHGTGAPQTIEHSKLTKEIVGTYIEVTLEEFKQLKLENPKFPLHINVLVDDTDPHTQTIDLGRSIHDFTSFMAKVQRPLFLFSHEEKSMRPFIEKFIKTGLPFYAESLSQGRDLSTIDSEKTLLKSLKENKFDSVIRIGHTPLSKVWRVLENNHLPLFSFDERSLPAMSYGQVCSLSSQNLLTEEKFWEGLSHLSPMNTHSEEDGLNPLISKYPDSEMSVMKQIQNQLPINSLIYLGNSLVIRFFELVQKKQFRIFGNRGVNGIDGQLATAIGIAQGTSDTVYCILGDVTTMYDLSSLREIPNNLKLIIINNLGGRIFDMLGLDKRIVMEHEQDFKSICTALGLKYSYQDIAQLSDSQVLELRPLQTQTRSFLKEWNA